MLLIGVVMVLSASFARAYYVSGEPLGIFMRQLIFAVSGVAIMLVVSRVSVKTMRRWSMHLLIVAVAMLVLVLLVGSEAKGAKRWIGVGGEGGFTFQPSEIAKLAVIMSFSAMICSFGKKMKTFKYGVAPFIVIIAVIVGLLVLEPHFSASVIIIALAGIMMFAGGVRLRWFALAGAAALLVAALLILPRLQPAPGDTGTAHTEESESGGRFGYAGGRIGAWLNPEADPLDGGFQILQSLYAVGSGGLFGQGLGQSRQKYLYLPEEHNDYIFAIVCEELGFIGAMLILVLYALLIIRGFWLALHAKDRYGSLITTGITSLLAIQVFLNVAVVTNLVPATGISLPFFSYGGTALWIQLVQMGIILAVSREIPLTKAG
jgi:cell division protein FtsW